MTGPLILDAEAVQALAGPAGQGHIEVRAAMRAAQRLGREVIVPTVILAELYRGPQRSQFIDSCLSRETGIRTRDTDRPFARLVGGVLSGAGVGSQFLADAHVVAAAVERAGGIILTGDPKDMNRLAAPYRTIVVASLAS
ncbi:MAG: PIN domain-containing protein [Actinomycetota bacterium]